MLLAGWSSGANVRTFEAFFVPYLQLESVPDPKKGAIYACPINTKMTKAVWHGMVLNFATLSEKRISNYTLPLAVMGRILVIFLELKGFYWIFKLLGLCEQKLFEGAAA